MPTVQEGVALARERERDVLSWFKLASEKKQEEYLNTIRERNLALEERKAAVDIRLKNIEAAGKIADIMATEDKAVRQAKFREWQRSNGVDPKSPIAKEREATAVNASPEARRRMAAGAAQLATYGDPVQTQQAFRGFASGEVGFQDLEATVKGAQSQRTMGRMDAGQPSVSSSPSFPATTSRVANRPEMPATSLEPGAAMRGPVESALGQKAKAGMAGGTAKARQGLGMDSLMFDSQPVATMGDLFSPPKVATKPQPAAQGPSYAGMSGDQQLNAVLDSTMQAESGGRAAARNPRSSATGAFQYIDSTWLNSVAEQNPEWAKGLSKRDILAARNDPDIAREVARNDFIGYAARLEGKGYPATGGNLYLLHHFGKGATSMLAEDPSTPFADVVSRKVLAANPQYADMTVGEVRRTFEMKHGSEPLFSSAGGQVSAEQPSATVPELGRPAGEPASESERLRAQADTASQRAQTAVTEFGDVPGAKESSALYAEDAKRLYGDAKTAAGREESSRNVASSLNMLRDALNRTTPDEWKKTAGYYRGADTSIADDPARYVIGAAGRLGTAIGEEAFGMGAEGNRGASAVRSSFQPIVTKLVSDAQTILRQKGVSDSDPAWRQVERLEQLGGNLLTLDSREEAFDLLNGTIRPLWSQITGSEIPELDPLDAKMRVKKPGAAEPSGSDPGLVRKLDAFLTRNGIPNDADLIDGILSLFGSGN